MLKIYEKKKTIVEKVIGFVAKFNKKGWVVLSSSIDLKSFKETEEEE